MRSIIDYDKERDTITNMAAMSRGRGCKMLLVIDSPYVHEYVALRWLRKLPAATARCQHVVRL